MTHDRRSFLSLASQASGLVLLGALPARGDEAPWRARETPFTLGVASGDPAPDGFVLWTRLAPDPRHGGGMPGKPVKVGWEVATDDGFRRVVAQGDALALPELAHSVHVEVAGLLPSRDYFYRFTAGGERSTSGRARTAPAAGDLAANLVFGVASCQSYQSGYFTALRHLADENLDAVLHLGDYIYESGHWGRTPVRPQGPEVVTLAEYRNRYALYKSDPDLQAVHARHSFIVTWDDHEVENNYAGAISQGHSLAPPLPPTSRRRVSGLLRAPPPASLVHAEGPEPAPLPPPLVWRYGASPCPRHAAVPHRPALRRRGHPALPRSERPPRHPAGCRAEGLVPGRPRSLRGAGGISC